MSKIKTGLESATVASAKALAKTQTEVDKVLWGKQAAIYSATINPNGTVTQTTATKQASDQKRQSSITTATQTSTTNTQQQARAGSKIPNPLDYGVIPLLTVVTSIDVCDIVNYLYNQIGGPSPKPRSKNPTGIEKSLYFVQDKTLEIQKAIDTFYSFPDRLIGRFTDISYEETTQQQVNAQTNTSTTNEQAQQNYQQGNTPGANSSGINAQKFNLFNLINYIQTSVSSFLSTKDVQGNQILTTSDIELVNQVPFLQQNLTIFTDYLNIINRYANYESIPNEDVQRILDTINKIRATCVTIQSLDFRSPASFLALVPSATVRQQITELQKLIDPTKLIPTLSKIAEALKAFNKFIEKAEAVIVTSQLYIRIAVVLLKVFRIIIRILKGLPIPNRFTLVGLTVTFSSLTSKTEQIVSEVEEILEQIKSLLNVVVSFLDYLQANIREILTRINSLLTNLRLCENLKDSPVITNLEQAQKALVETEARIQTFLTNYRTRLEAQKTFGDYTIKVVEEQLVDEGIVNKRRRGIALDKTGKLAVASDLTFATDENIIVQEVKLKLISAGLVVQAVPSDPLLQDLAAFLQDDDLLNTEDNLGDLIGDAIKDDLDRYNDSQAEGRALRRKSKAAMRRAQQLVRAEIDKLKAENILKTPSPTTQAVSGQTTPARQETYRVSVFAGTGLIRSVIVKAISTDEAIKLAKDRVDPNDRHPTWKYKARKGN